MVLLNGVNNDKYVCSALIMIAQDKSPTVLYFSSETGGGNRPFHVFHRRGNRNHGATKGKDFGNAIPTYIINAPGGNGKTPLLPSYIISRGKDYVTIRTWEGKIVKCENTHSMNIKGILETFDDAM